MIVLRKTAHLPETPPDDPSNMTRAANAAAHAALAEAFPEQFLRDGEHLDRHGRLHAQSESFL